MRTAPELVEGQKTLLDTVASALRQRLGKDRMELWFGSGTRWSLSDTHSIHIEVASEFLANCINTMFRSDLQAVVTQYAGPDWGCKVAPRARKSGLPVEKPAPEQSSIAYDGGRVLSDSTGPANSIPSFQPSLSPVNAAAAVPPPSSVVTPDESVSEDAFHLDEMDARTLDAGSQTASTQRSEVPQAGPSLRLVRPERTGSRSSQKSQEPEIDVDRLVALRILAERRWEDFVVGEHNRFAYTGAEMVLEHPGQVNPLLIHGPNGVGKTHLALGLAQQLRHKYRMRRVLVLTGEQFTIEYTESARGGGFANFRRKYRDVEAIVIDDIQFCLGKSGTLSELRNTIDMLLRDRRQVILVADRGLHDLAGLGADLYARLSGGMSCGIDPMDSVTRKLLLQRLCLKQQISASDTALDAIATQCGGDARILQGIAHRLAAQQRLQGTVLLPEDAVRCTLDLVRASQPIVRLTDIERVVCETFGLENEMLRAKTKCQSISQPRMLAMFLARKYTRTALSEIGEYFGNRQHSTVISAQKKVEQWLLDDDAISLGRSRVQVREILRNLESTLQVG